MENPKRKYIEAAYELMRDSGVENVTIRKVAARLGCSAPAIYKHFGDLDELLDVASIRFLRDYAEDARLLSQVDLNPLELNLQLWECLAFYSFNNAPVAERLFFSEQRTPEYGEHLVSTYYECFPEELEHLKGFMRDMLATTDIRERNGILLGRAVDAGMLAREAAEILRDNDVLLFRGILAVLHSTYREMSRPREATKLFMKLVVASYRAHLNPGFTILVVTPERPILNIDALMSDAKAYRAVACAVPRHETTLTPDDKEAA